MAKRKAKKPLVKAKKLRSPKYPALGLARVVECTRMIYTHETKNRAATPVIMKHLGYSEGSGAGFSALAALRNFGVLEGRHGEYRLTDRGLDIAIAEPGTEKHTVAVQAAALAPAIHREIWEKYGGHLPSDENLRYYLERERGFTATALKQFIPQLRATLEFAGVRQGQEIDDSEAVSDRPDPSDPNRGMRIQQSSPDVSLSGNQLQRTKGVPLPVIEADGSIQIVNIPHLSETAFDFLKGLLDTYKAAIVRVSPDRADAESSNSDDDGQ